ncbi:MAG: signal recognition particle protein [Propionibacterium sp.]|nr:MAG: signal recognition particle protein [Propionibacterium sp.]
MAGKLAHWLKEQGHAPLLVAADLQRPNAVNQLQVVGQRAGAHTFAPEPGNGVGDPVQVARDSIGYAKQKLHDVVIVDTAGRLGIDAEMMQQAIDIRNAVQPDEVLFVIDAMIGQDAVSTAQAFADGVGFDGVCLSKLDGDARGGAALSVARVTGKPIMFASNGEHIGDFDAFYPDRMASRILGMGDVLTLIEQAEKVFDEEESKAAAEKLVSGEGFGLDDFLAQMQQMRKMGPMSKILGMLPGMNQMKDQINQIDEKEIDRVEAIIFSMTPAERADVKILNGSRRARIARGAGVEVRDVNSLVKRFLEAKKMMQSMSGMMSGGAMPGPGGRMSKGPAKRTKQQAKKGAKRGKRPRPSAAPKKAPKAPSPADIEAAMGEFQLPPELAAMLDEQNRGPRQ